MRVPAGAVEDVQRDGPTIYVRGEGVRITDINGREYLDMMSSHTRAEFAGLWQRRDRRGGREQLEQLHYVGTVTNLAPPTIELAGKIADLAPDGLSKVMFVSGGSEAVEAAIKIAKQYHAHSGKARAHKIISRWNAYHGATMGALGATDWLGTRHISEPGVPGYSLDPRPEPLPQSVRHGGGGVRATSAPTTSNGRSSMRARTTWRHSSPSRSCRRTACRCRLQHYFRRVREICDRYDVLLIVDEVITGFGRPAAWFAIEHFGIEPDIMTMAKALTAGYMPMGAVIARPEIDRRAAGVPPCAHLQRPRRRGGGGEYGDRHQGARRPDRRSARRMASTMLDSLQECLDPHPIVGQVRGKGMWLAVDFTADKETRAPFEDDTVRAVVRRMYDHGVIASPIGTAFELAPPLIATKADIDETVRVAAQAIDEVARERKLI